MALIASTIGAICERGTVASSNIVVGFNLASADGALRRAVEAHLLPLHLCDANINCIHGTTNVSHFSISRLTTSGGPSCSINKIAFTSVGKPI